ncbi:MAG: hypothetical protein LBQ19_06465 [Synergistaceae bacterium]|jgi:epoxyqueuosine reductase|nr:hypothetical protein [Synergistaceae bacterium]
MNDGIALKIVRHAVSLSYERCGIIRLDAMRGYALEVEKRARRFPESAESISRFPFLADPREKYPWASSVVICSQRYGNYRIPKNLDGLIGKSYLCDERKDAMSDGYRDRRRLERYMTDELGLRTTPSDDLFVTALRWAAVTAGLGAVRRNNFFYGDRGSYYTLSAFLIDRDIEYIHETEGTPCPDDCNRCVKSCPAGSLAEPYAMNRVACVSHLTTWDFGADVYGRYGEELGNWIYGCDVCQDVCPFNRNQLSGEVEFPGLDELAREISPESVIAADYRSLRDLVAKKFWYIKPEDLWKWKCSAINAIKNLRGKGRLDAVKPALHDEDERVRAMAGDVLS